MPLVPLGPCIAALLAATPLDEAIAATGAPLAELITGEGGQLKQYDLASVTKPITAIALLDLGLELDDQVRAHLPAFRRREPITVRQLLEHTSRLRPVVAVDDLPRARPDLVLARIVTSRLRGEAVYSDLNFVVAGQLVEALTKRSLDEVLRERLFAPLAMTASTWHPRTHAANGAPPGQPHDPIARACLTATSAPGHAGLFSTASDLGNLLAAIVTREARFASLRDELQRGAGKRSVAGWSAWGDGAWAKVGWTGTFLWFEPVTKRWAVFLTNRTAGDHGWLDFELVVREAKRP